MFLPFLLALQSPASLPTMDEVKLGECMKMAGEDAPSAIAEASAWSGKGGGWRARQCLGFAQFRAGNASAAMTAYEQAAMLAATAQSIETGKLWAQAGNAALIAREPAKAIIFLDKAVASGQVTGEGLGELHIDRARAYAAGGDMTKAKADLEQAHNLVPQDPLGWLLSATLARREGDLTRAKADFATAAKLAAQDPAIALEAGNIAISANDEVGARKNWQAAIDIEPGSAAAETAKAHLAQLGAASAAPPPAVSPKIR